MTDTPLPMQRYSNLHHDKVKVIFPYLSAFLFLPFTPFSHPLEPFPSILLAPIDNNTLLILLVKHVTSLDQPIQHTVVSSLTLLANHGHHLPR